MPKDLPNQNTLLNCNLILVNSLEQFNKIKKDNDDPLLSSKKYFNLSKEQSHSSQQTIVPRYGKVNKIGQKRIQTKEVLAEQGYYRHNKYDIISANTYELTQANIQQIKNIRQKYTFLNGFILKESSFVQIIRFFQRRLHSQGIVRPISKILQIQFILTKINPNTLTEHEFSLFISLFNEIYRNWKIYKQQHNYFPLLRKYYPKSDLKTKDQEISTPFKSRFKALRNPTEVRNLKAWNRQTQVQILKQKEIISLERKINRIKQFHDCFKQNFIQNTIAFHQKHTSQSFKKPQFLKSKFFYLKNYLNIKKTSLRSFKLVNRKCFQKDLNQPKRTVQEWLLMNKVRMTSTISNYSENSSLNTYFDQKISEKSQLKVQSQQQTSKEEENQEQREAQLEYNTCINDRKSFEQSLTESSISQISIQNGNNSLRMNKSKQSQVNIHKKQNQTKEDSKYVDSIEIKDNQTHQFEIIDLIESKCNMVINQNKISQLNIDDFPDEMQQKYVSSIEIKSQDSFDSTCYQTSTFNEITVKRTRRISLKKLKNKRIKQR